MSVRDGYKVTELGLIPSEWEIKSLGELCKDKPSYGASVSATEYDFNLPRYIRITDIRESGFLEKEGMKCCVLENYDDYSLIIGDIVFARSGATVGKTYMYRIDDGNCVYAGYLIKFVPNQKFLKTEYLFQFTHSHMYYDWVRETLREGAQPNINAQEYSSLGIPLPPLSEQQRIIEILSSNDALITKTDELIEKTKEVKQGLMQELLTKGIGHTEFKDSELGRIPKEWDVKTLSDICKLRNEKCNPVGEENRNYIALEHMEQCTGKINGIGNSSETTSLKAVFYKGDILFGKLRPYLRKYWLAEFDGVCATEILPLITKENNLKEFCFYLIQQDIFIEHTVKGSFGTKMPRTSWNEMAEFTFAIPPIEEQKQIASIIGNIDDKLEALTKRKQQLEEIKQGLMQDLLTGRVRVNLN